MQQPTTAEYLKAENDVRATLLQGLGALALLLGAFIIWQQLLATREGQVTDRFTRAIDQLGKDSLDVRLGGIYALEQIAKDSPRDYGPIVEVLTAFVREHAPWPPASGVPSPKPPADIQAVLTVLGRRVIPQDWNGPRLDLSQTDLRGTDLRGAHLEGTYLVSASLEEAHLGGVHLEGAVLTGAHLGGADLNAAHLESTFLDAAQLEGASLISAHLEGASLDAAHLAHLGGAHLEGASLVSARLEGAFLNEADLDGTDFKGANLKEADLSNAQHLNTALNLTKEQLASAKRR